LWDSSSGKELARLPHDAEVRAVAFTPDGKRLASTGADRLVHLWDADTGRELQSLSGHEDRVEALAFSPDGKRLATGGRDGQLRLWDVTGKDPVQSTKFESGFRALAWASDGKTIALATAAGDVLLFSATLNRESKRLDTAHAICL